MGRTGGRGRPKESFRCAPAGASVQYRTAGPCFHQASVERTNRLGAGGPDAPREVQWILRRACYDCHSTESRWPIWAYVAPMSWRVVADVRRAREVMNFSDWAAYPFERRVALRATVGPATASHRMPLWYYLTLHPDARLSPADLAALQTWSQGATQEARTAPVR